MATDENDCEVEAVINNVLAFTTPLSFGDGSGLRLFPNPVEDRFTIHDAEFTQGTAFDISIYNMMGEKMYTEVNSKQRSVDCRHLQKGLYYLEISSGKKTYRTKFIKQ